MRRPDFRAWLLAILPLLLLTGCAFVSGYDPVTDAGIQDVAKKSETIFASVAVNGASYSQTRASYRELDGTLAAVALRAGIYGTKNKAEQDVVALLQTELGELEEFHRTAGPYRLSQLAGARSLIRSLLHHEISKKQAVPALGKGGAQ